MLSNRFSRRQRQPSAGVTATLRPATELCEPTFRCRRPWAISPEPQPRIGQREGGGLGLAVKLRVEDASLPQAELAAIAKEAHEKLCPYSHATRGNVDVQIEGKGAYSPYVTLRSW